VEGELGMIIFCIHINIFCPHYFSSGFYTTRGEKVFKIFQPNRVYLHKYILTVADIFEAPPNKISGPTE
jgi:hypothetical protein